MTTQRSTVHVADASAPNDHRLWLEIDEEQWQWLADHSAGYLYQLEHGGEGVWHEEESDLGRLSKCWPGVLFVSDSTSEGARWRFFALDNRTERALLTDGVWTMPDTLGLGPATQETE